MTPLYLTLHRWAATPYVWGEADCMTSIADWVLAQKGFDPASEMRGTYGDPAVCTVARRYAANPLPMWDRSLTALPRAQSAAPGDIGLVVWPGERRLSGALCLGREWASRIEGRGVLTGRVARIEAAWGIGYAA